MYYTTTTIEMLYYIRDVIMELSCRESGLDCDYVAEGKTQDEVLNNISEHAVNFRNMRVEDIYEENISSMPSHR
jgi:predicted small metal-binding protein